MREFAVLMCLALLLLARTGIGQEKVPSISKEETDQGFVSLFDGKSLDGWKGATKGYTAAGGLLTCVKTGGGNLFTEKEYGDFIFRFDFKFEPAGNNGVSVRGHEIQILDDYAPIHKDIKPCQYHGSIYCKVPAKPGSTKPAGEWNSEEIHVKGSQWKVIVNGVVIVDADIGKVVGLEDLAKKTKGPIGFLGHGTHVEFRNLRIKAL